VNRASELDVHTSDELMTRSLLLKTLYTKQGPSPTRSRSTQVAIPEIQQVISDPCCKRLADLRSGNADLVLRALESPVALDPVLVTAAIVLLAWTTSHRRF